MEHFLGGATVDSGCYSTESFENDAGEQMIYQQEQGEYIDTTFEQVAFEEELEQMLEEIEEITQPLVKK